MIDFAATGLPAAAVLGDLKTALADGPNAVLVAPPGAGKTTLVPLALLGEVWVGGGRIVMLEPRRLAARAAARRMAALLGERVGDTVGYRMRLDSKISPKTRIEIVTEGVFARMILDDPELSGIAVVIFDEFHERSLDADFSLALALDVQSALREDLRLIVMSATLDGGRVAQLLDDAPVIESAGRTFPADIRHRPRRPDQRIEDAVAEAIRVALREEEGSLLAFLPGQAEIRRTAERLEPHLPADAYLAPLFGAMDIADQDRAILPAEPGRRKIVLATAIAESSVTIDGVRVVIDSGLSRQPAFEPGQAITRLETVRVSRASADQRAGRAGRTRPGVAIRLWHEGQTAALVPFDPPEIARTDLTRLMLDCLAWGVADPTALRFLDPPPAAALSEARSRLEGLGAIDGPGRLTAKGQRLRTIALPVPLAAMVAAAENSGDAKRRARLAVLITERGLGGTTTDLDRRLQAFEADRSPRARQARHLADRIAADVRLPAGKGSDESVGVMLLDAFAERVAKARAAQPGRFVMAGGRGVTIEETDPLARASFIIAADATGAAAQTRLLAGAAISRADIEDRLEDRIIDRVEMAFDAESARLSARQIRHLGAITLSSAPRPVKAGDAATAALLDAIRAHGLSLLPWSEKASSVRDRLVWLHARGGEPWPDMGDDALVASADDWLAPFLAGRTDFAGVPLIDALLMRAGPAGAAELDRLAPSHFTAPTGTRIALRYPADGAAPVLAIRVQELYGLTRHPVLLDGAVPLLIELLSPAGRPIQRTTDLPAFWSGSWDQVRAEMRGRYPKHVWPDDPASADPTRRAKPRKH
ncbi:MAG: ATP-dependent helicase HrpB [Roseitalea sp.]|jgi:ATP-dependent helicase HrpB|nr:ATP-dependent helicase HrpB [Roseitalea sp.]MBO6722125.1 ATP-dependent helicase HrpB [Roseitalea sp.]MBO6744947.1 ATP-dependent helicase HrpB [Roseitalea sp.]